MRSLLMAAFASITIMGAGAADAVTVETTNFIASPTFFNGFEGIASDPSFIAPFFFPANTAYSEGGVTVEYVGSAPNNMWVQYLHEGNYGWYANGGGTGYTKVTLTSGADFSALQFLSGTGFGGGSTTYYQALLNGSVVSTGALGTVGNDLRFQGLSGGGFDEVRLQSNFTASFNASNYEAGAYDSFAANAVAGVPEPATWGLMIIGFGLVGFSARRRAVAFAA